MRRVGFICTGNTCRSPMAAAMCRSALAARLGCDVADLPSRGWDVFSAGVAAAAGEPATPEAAAAAAAHGVGLADHRASQLDEALLRSADRVVVMTEGHRQLLTRALPGVGPTPELLCGEGADLPDPIGGDAGVYADCAAEVRRQVDRLITEWLER